MNLLMSLCILLAFFALWSWHPIAAILFIFLAIVARKK